MLFVTPALGRLRQEEYHELQASQSQSETLYQKEKNQGASKKVEWVHTPLSPEIKVLPTGLTRGATPAGYPLTSTSLCPCTLPRAPVHAHSKGRDVGESKRCCIYAYTSPQLFPVTWPLTSFKVETAQRTGLINR